MATLGGVLISDHLILSGLETAPDIAYSQRRTLGGVSVAETAPIAGGRALRLSGEHHFTLLQIQAVKTIAAAGQPVQLIHPRGTYTVLITETPVVPSITCNDPDGSMRYSGDILMIEHEG